MHAFSCPLLAAAAHTNPQYAEMEMRHRFVNHARNIWDRAVSVLPRVDQLWYKYVHMEEMVKETAKARLIFDRWMAFEPDHAAWMAYIKVRQGAPARLRLPGRGRGRAVSVRCLGASCNTCCDMICMLHQMAKLAPCACELRGSARGLGLARTHARTHVLCSSPLLCVSDSLLTHSQF